MNEFKVGDKVVCVDSAGAGWSLTKGETYTVAAVRSDDGGGYITVLEDPHYVSDAGPSWAAERFEPASSAVSPELEAQIEQSAFGVGDRVVDEAGYAGEIFREDDKNGFVDVLFDRFVGDKFNMIRMPKSKLRAEKKIAAVAIPTEEVIAQDVGSAATSKPVKSDGGSSDYYKIQIKTSHGIVDVEVNDVIYAMVDGDFDLANVLKACRRMYLASKGCGKEGVDIEYDVNKSKWFLEDFKMRFGEK